jgi:hypothetical protein
LELLVGPVDADGELLLAAEEEPQAAKVTPSAATRARRRPTLRLLRGIFRSIRRVGQCDDEDALGTDTPYRVHTGADDYVSIYHK